MQRGDPVAGPSPLYTLRHLCRAIDGTLRAVVQAVSGAPLSGVNPAAPRWTRVQEPGALREMERRVRRGWRHRGRPRDANISPCLFEVEVARRLLLEPELVVLGGVL